MVKTQTITSKKSRTLSRKQKGGFIEGDISAIIEFLQNSDIKAFKKGTVGIIYKAEPKPTYTNSSIKIKHRTVNRFGQPVKHLLIKLCFLSEKRLEVFEGFESIKSEAFTRETTCHKDISERSNNHCQPICPTLLYSGIYHMTDVAQNDKAIVTLFNLIEPVLNSSVINKLKTHYYTSYYQTFLLIQKIGIIIMEYDESYVSFSKLHISSFTKEKYGELMIRIMYAHVKLAKLGYFHGDWHSGNVLYSQTDNSVLLIDFGICVKLTEEEYQFALNCIEDHSYIFMLSYFYYHISISNSKNITLEILDNISNSNNKNKSKPYYGFLLGIYDMRTRPPQSHKQAEYPSMLFGGEEYVNNRIKQLFEEEYDKCKKNKKILHRLTNTNPNARRFLNGFANVSNNNNTSTPVPVLAAALAPAPVAHAATEAT